MRGVPWYFETFPQFSTRSSAMATALNYGCYVCHKPRSECVMGESFYERDRDRDELRAYVAPSVLLRIAAFADPVL